MIPKGKFGLDPSGPGEGTSCTIDEEASTRRKKGRTPLRALGPEIEGLAQADGAHSSDEQVVLRGTGFIRAGSDGTY